MTKPSVPPADPLVSSIDHKRLGSQNQEILERLRRGPATNKQLAAISINFTRRISDLKKAGHRIEAKRHRQTGIWTYRLENTGTATHESAPGPGSKATPQTAPPAAAGLNCAIRDAGRLSDGPQSAIRNLQSEIATADLVAWFRSHRHNLPREPFELSPGVRIADPPLFYAALDRDIAAGTAACTPLSGAAGPRGPRWHSGALCIQLGALRALFDVASATSASSAQPKHQRKLV
ncbi:MAG: hypothetical protein WD648_10175 [Planctomycetaceae bacterium]